jgi:hypothetical protein
MLVHIRRLALAGLGAIAVCSLLVSPAGATSPEIVRFPVAITQTDTTSCDFDIIEEFEGTITIITYFDEAGNPTKVFLQLPFVGTLTNAETGASVTARQELVVVEDLEQGTSTLVGLRFLVTFEGVGHVLLDAGRIVFDASGTPTFVAGPHDVEIEGDFEEFCAALS